jgi:hypothetical protein
MSGAQRNGAGCSTVSKTRLASISVAIQTRTAILRRSLPLADTVPPRNPIAAARMPVRAAMAVRVTVSGARATPPLHPMVKRHGATTAGCDRISAVRQPHRRLQPIVPRRNRPIAPRCSALEILRRDADGLLGGGDGDSARSVAREVGVQHFLKRPLASRHRVVGAALAAAAGGHFMNLPLLSLHRAAAAGVGFGLGATVGAGAGFAAAGGHFTNLPCASLHGAAASAGVAKKIATPAASNIFRFIVHPLEPCNRRAHAILSRSPVQ